uniref:Uncharacterized protein n=1 Tax=uncultured bacterium contig00026 TaxID=1181515 RepID=A0A806KAP9_9BACT|nr:hypothetical protein [uncultured bacterium contig00026]
MNEKTDVSNAVYIEDNPDKYLSVGIAICDLKIYDVEFLNYHNL